MKKFGIVLLFLWMGVLAHGQRFVRTANTLDQLLALNPNDVHTNALVLGRSSVGDGQPGIWSYDRNSTTATNNSPPTVTKPNGYGGRWKLILAPAAGAGTGDVVGPPTATDNAIARFDGTTGELLQNSAATIADSTGDITAGKFNGVAISGSGTPSIAVTGAVTLAGVNNGDQTITLSGDATGTGTGPITVTIPNGTITTAKMGGDVTAAGKALMDDASAAAQRVTLQLVPGTDVQAYDADLLAWAGLTSAADTLGYFNGPASAATTPLTAAGRTIVGAADAAAQRVAMDVPQTTRSISTQHSLTGGGNLSADRTLSLVNDSASPGNNKVYGTDGAGIKGWKDDPAGGSGAPTTVDYLVRTADAGLSAERVVTDTASITVDWATGGQAKFVREALTGDVTAAQGSNATTIPNDTVSNAKMANMAASTIKARVTGSTGDPEDATLSQVLDLVGSPANGDMLHRTGGSWARLAAPTQLSGSTLYYGPNGVEWVNPATHYIYRYEFLTGSALNTEWASNSSGGSSSYTTGETGAMGVLQVITGTGTTGYRHQFIGGNNSFYLGNGRTIITWKCKIPTLSDATDTFTAYVGLYDHWTTVVDGVWFEYSHGVNSGKWECKVSDNSAQTITDSGVTATTTMTTFLIDVNAGATEAKFYINGSLVHTESGANIPQTASRPSNVGWGITKSAGTTNRAFNADYVDVYVKY